MSTMTIQRLVSASVLFFLVAVSFLKSISLSSADGSMRSEYAYLDMLGLTNVATSTEPARVPLVAEKDQGEEEDITFWTSLDVWNKNESTLLLQHLDAHLVGNRVNSTVTGKELNRIPALHPMMVVGNDTIKVVESVGPKRVFLALLQQHFPSPPGHDAQYIRNKRPRPFTVPASEYGSICAKPGEGPEGPNGYQLLTRKIRIVDVPAGATDDEITSYTVTNMTTINEMTTTTTTTTTVVKRNATTESKVKIMCAVYTYHGGTQRLDAILETWGKRCDGFLAASDVTNQSTGALHLQQPNNVIAQKTKKDSKDGGSYSHIWQKVRSLLANIYQHHLDDYDFFHISGDDAFIIVENLRAFLSEKIEEHGEGQPLYIGTAIRPVWNYKLPTSFIYAGGGPGYTLSRSAVKTFVEHALLTCEATLEASAEDLLMGWCFETVLGIPLTHAFDSKHEHRYHGLDPEMLFTWKTQMKTKHSLAMFWRRQLRLHANLIKGRPFVSFDRHKSMATSSVAIHLIKSADKMRRFEKLLYRKHLPDCSCDASNEPGWEVPSVNLTDSLLRCTWNNVGDGRYQNKLNPAPCRSYRTRIAKAKPPFCNNNKILAI